MKKIALLTLSLFMAFSVVACEKDGSTDSATSAEAPKADAIGIEACDNYIAKYSKCLDKIPEASRASMKEALDQTVKSWKQSAGNDAAKEALAAGCQQALEAAKSGMASFGCEF